MLHPSCKHNLGPSRHLHLPLYSCCSAQSRPSACVHHFLLPQHPLPPISATTLHPFSHASDSFVGLRVLHLFVLRPLRAHRERALLAGNIRERQRTLFWKQIIRTELRPRHPLRPQVPPLSPASWLESWPSSRLRPPSPLSVSWPSRPSRVSLPRCRLPMP